MEELLEESMYVIDLGNVDTAPEIIFELSSVLDNEEAKNKRICLKLGNVNLNQAQLLSIKSLINGIESTLSCLDTRSVETEKTALSLGIIISNVSEENTLEVAPAMPYKTAEEFREEVLSAGTFSEAGANSESTADTVIIEESEAEQVDCIAVPNSEDKTISEAEPVDEDIQKEQDNKSSNISNQDGLPDNENYETEQQEQTIEPKNEIQDELDAIFGSDPVKTSIFELSPKVEDEYEQREELGDIVVPLPEYTKEDIELEGFPTKYIKQTIRSGQVINYEGNIVIIGDCHVGCEITALGDITVWGVLSGIAHAGSGGNQKAKVRALRMNAIQLRIANCYSRRPDSLNTVYIEKTNSFTPEEARIVNSEIVVFKIND